MHIVRTIDCVVAIASVFESGRDSICEMLFEQAALPFDAEQRAAKPHNLLWQLLLCQMNPDLRILGWERRQDGAQGAAI